MEASFPTNATSKNKRVGVLRFLGTNCDLDTLKAFTALGCEARYLWWEDHFDPEDFDYLVLPGGFSHGDYLRSGAFAAQAPVCESLMKAIDQGVPTLGICNGFQILCELGALPGALVSNTSGRFKDFWVRVKSNSGATYKMPIAHGDGRYFLPPSQIDKLDTISWLTYEANPNGSFQDLAGVKNEKSTVFGLMPHPERAFHDWMGSSDGKKLLEEFLGV